jgi:hypothetical protein
MKSLSGRLTLEKSGHHQLLKFLCVGLFQYIMWNGDIRFPLFVIDHVLKYEYLSFILQISTTSFSFISKNLYIY